MTPWATIWKTAPCEALLAEDEDAQGHEAHVADRRVGDEPLEVGLADGHDGAVEHADDRERDDEPGQVAAWRRGRAAG